LKTTIWPSGQQSPTSSVLYIDVWKSIGTNANTQQKWEKIRYYIVLGTESYPWAHISFSHLRGGSGVTINGKHRRLDKYAAVYAEVGPRYSFALGEHFYGAFDEVRIWEGVSDSHDTRVSLCPDAVQSKLELYLPFNECKGHVFAGYTRNGAVCALLYGAYEEPSKRSYDESEDNVHTSHPIWKSNRSPVASQECTASIGVDSCVDARQKIEVHAKLRPSLAIKKENNNENTNAYSNSRYKELFKLSGFSVAVVGLIILAVVIIAGILFFRTAPVSAEDNNVRPRSKSIHTV